MYTSGFIKLIQQLFGINNTYRTPNKRNNHKTSRHKSGWSNTDRQQAKKKLTQMTIEMSNIHNLTYNKLFIRSQKTKRGTCSSHRNISINIKLANAPDRIIEYVICHELTHLVHMNHSSKFWNELAKIYPHTYIAKQWLREHGDSLMKKRGLVKTKAE